MKRSLGFYVIMVMMIFCLIGSSLGEEDLLQSGYDGAIATSGVDVIVVLDMSGSMEEPNDALNDEFGYRRDATAMLIGMLDAGSRIGVVPFGGTINDENVKNLSGLSTSDDRNPLIKYIYSLKTVGYGTNYGAALMRALYMLNSRENTMNSPMIVLLTDGKNTISGSNRNPGKASVAPSYRWENNQIVKKDKDTFNTELSNDVTLEAKNCAQALGIPIYTVSLTVSPDNISGGVSLRDIADDTGGKVFFAQTKDDAKNMPRYFAEILADRIGSSVENNLKPVLAGDHYEVTIPVLNKSILELNVILPIERDSSSSKGNLSGIDRESIKVNDQNGIELTKADGVDRWYSDTARTGSFAIIKIQNPDTVSHGTKWSIHFKSNNDPGTIPFNFLYNYNIKLDASVDSPNALYKADILKLHGFFVTQDGQKVDDETLYEDRSNDEDFGKYEWSTIHSSWRLFYANPDGSLGHAVTDSQMMENRMAQKDFYTEISLAPYELKAGSYYISVYAEGAGLKRSMYLPITLLNHKPGVAPFEIDAITVNKREEAGREHQNDSWTVNGTSGKLKINGGQEFNVNEIITDADSTDQNALHRSFALESVSEQNAADLVLNADGTIDVKTFVDGSTNGVKTGKAEYELKYSDGTTEGTGSVSITVDIISDDEALKQQYDPEIIISGDHLSGAEQAYESKKNADLTITLKLKDKNDSSYARNDIMKGLYSDLKIQDRDENPIRFEAVNQGEPQSGAFIWTVNTGNEDAEWTAKIQLGTYDIAPIVIRIPNNAEPKASPAAANSLLNYKGEKVPAFLRSIVGKDTPKDDPSIQVKVGELFSDDDNDQLTFGDPVYMNEGNQNIEIEKSAIKLVPSNGSDAELTAPAYRVEVNGEPTALFRYTATGKVKITATDGDGKTSDYTLTVQIVDLYNKMLTWIIIILIAIAILVILILIIHQIRKPVFPKLELTIREEPSLYETGREMLSPVKTPTNANAVGIDSDIAAKHGLALEFLQNIIIKPIRSRMAVGLICKKDMSGQEALLDDVRMKAKKQYVWSVGQELSIRSEHGDGMVVIKLESPTETGEDDPMEDFGGNSDWDEVSAGDMKNQTGRKHGKKVAKKQAPVQEETPAGDKDDFEF